MILSKSASAECRPRLSICCVSVSVWLAECGEVDSVGERYDERVECLSPALGVGSERAASGGAGVAEGEVEDLVDGVIGGERSACLCDFAELIVERLDGVGGVNEGLLQLEVTGLV